MSSHAYNRDRVGKRVALASLDDVRARLSDISTRLPSGDAYQLILDAKNNLAMAQDLIESELAGDAETMDERRQRLLKDMRPTGDAE